MDKRQLIDEIRLYNPTAQIEFLTQFDAEALNQYREHLQAAREKRLRINTWIRPHRKLKMVS